MTTTRKLHVALLPLFILTLLAGCAAIAPNRSTFPAITWRSGDDITDPAERFIPYRLVPSGVLAKSSTVGLEFVNDMAPFPEWPGAVITAFERSVPQDLEEILINRGAIPEARPESLTARKIDATVRAYLHLRLEQTMGSNCWGPQASECTGTLVVRASLDLIGINVTGNKIWRSAVEASSSEYQWHNRYRLTWQGEKGIIEDQRLVQIHEAAAEVYPLLLRKADEALTVARLAQLGPPEKSAVGPQGQEDGK